MQSEKIIIVDENDKQIGVKDIRKIDSNDIYRVSALWIENSKEDVLLAQRSFNKIKHPGKWGSAVAGTVEEYEDYDLNIYKEVEEEIGLTGEIFTKAHKARRTGKNNFFCQWYYLKIDRDIKDFKIQEEEVEAIKWFKKTDLEKELKSSPDKFLASTSDTLNRFKND